LTGFSVGARDGFRFTVPRLAEAAPGVYVARGYDFADISFVVTAEGSSPSTQGPRRHTRARRWRRWRRCAR
jgi:hypothetical protein